MGAGTLLNLNAELLTEGTSSLAFSSFVFNEGTPTVSTVDGSIQVDAASVTGIFLESDSLLVMEAENAQANIPKSNQLWEEATEQSGYSFPGYMASTPDVGNVYKNNALDQSPELQFEVEFETPGLYNFWARLAALSKKSNTMHIGLNGTLHETSSTVSVANDGAWHWTTAWDHGSKTAFEITTPGTYTINVWVREDGVLFDKLLFIIDDTYEPTGEGPPESTRAYGNVAAKANQATRDGLALNRQAEELPEAFALKGNYPNPFNPTTTIQFELPEASAVNLEIFDMMGRRVATLIDGNVHAGRHQVQWHATSDAGSRVASGMYLYRLKAGDFVSTKRMALMK